MYRWTGICSNWIQLCIYSINNFYLLQDVIETQERTITDLLKSVKEQHEQLNYQKIKIKSLEDKVFIHLTIIIHVIFIRNLRLCILNLSFNVFFNKNGPHSFFLLLFYN